PEHCRPVAALERAGLPRDLPKLPLAIALRAEARVPAGTTRRPAQCRLAGDTPGGSLTKLASPPRCRRPPCRVVQADRAAPPPRQTSECRPVEAMSQLGRRRPRPTGSPLAHARRRQ